MTALQASFPARRPEGKHPDSCCSWLGEEGNEGKIKLHAPNARVACVHALMSSPSTPSCGLKMKLDCIYHGCVKLWI